MFGRKHSLSERLSALGDAAALGAEYLSAEHAALTRVADAAGERRELSAEHTVVGFFGATGSGKTSLFSAVVGEDLSRTAAHRPTTSSHWPRCGTRWVPRSCSTGSRWRTTAAARGVRPGPVLTSSSTCRTSTRSSRCTRDRDQVGRQGRRPGVDHRPGEVRRLNHPRPLHPPTPRTAR
ncbi:hypothetical protein QP028_05005 [Corynebacterium suedekumii]|nr:hypothetical protein QP028_05005 [Corynebacterium suedekumii]